MENRPAGLFKVIVWFAWLAAITVLAAEPFRWEVEYFRVHGSLLYFRAIVGLLLLLIPVCFLYVRWRRGGWYRYELPVIAGAAICLAAIEQPRGFGWRRCSSWRASPPAEVWRGYSALPSKAPAETVGVGFAIGAAALIPLLFILGLLHAYYWPVFLLLLVAPLVLGRRDALRRFAGHRATLAAASERPGSLEHPLFGVGVIFLAAGRAMRNRGRARPHPGDGCSEDASAGGAILCCACTRFEPVSALSYSYYPQGFEVLWPPSMPWEHNRRRR